MATRTFTVPAGTLLPNGATVTESIVHTITYDKSSITPAQAQKRVRQSARAEVEATYGVKIGVEALQRATRDVQRQTPTGKGSPRARGGRESEMRKRVRDGLTDHKTHPDWVSIDLGKPKAPVYRNIVKAIKEAFEQHKPDQLQVIGYGRQIKDLREKYEDLLAGDDGDIGYDPNKSYGKSPAYISFAAFEKQNPTLKDFETNTGIEIRNSIGWFIEYLPAGKGEERRARKGRG